MFWTDFMDFENDPWFGNAVQNLRRLQNEVSRLIEDVSPRTVGGQVFPAVDLYANNQQAVVRVEAPGVKADQLDLSVKGNVLTIAGERPAEELGTGDKLIRRERGVGAFSRSIPLPFEVESGAVQAQCRDGVLTVTLPRAEAQKPRRIEIK